jgi:hypothetical protein
MRASNSFFSKSSAYLLFPYTAQIILSANSLYFLAFVLNVSSNVLGVGGSESPFLVVVLIHSVNTAVDAIIGLVTICRYKQYYEDIET